MTKLFALLVVLGLGVVVGCDGPRAEKVKGKIEEAAQDTKDAAKEVTHDAAKDVKEAADKVEEETR